MSVKFTISNVEKSDINEKAGLYQFIVTFADQSKGRLFYSKNPDWKLINVSRLLNVPCPMCRKDYYCKCLEYYSQELDQEVREGGYLPE
jgi:hypothetical protein